jgi:metallo-beta-lactamase family protein
VFLTHGEETGLGGLKGRLSALIPGDSIIVPNLDDAFRLTSSGCSQVDLNVPRRLKPEKIASLDWHNDLSMLLLDVTEAVDTAADDRGRAAIIRRMRRALDDGGV